MKILIFGGTGEARDLANYLVAAEHLVTTSLAGRTQEPLLPKGDIRVGGYGGSDQLQAYFSAQNFDWVIDATHPFAEVMSQQLPEAARLAKTRFLRLQRPAWTKPEGAIWIDIPDLKSAIPHLPMGAKVLVTSGHRGLYHLNALTDRQFFVRLIEPPKLPLADTTTLMLSRPPYTLDAELALMRDKHITHLISKNAGGTQTRAKIDAAAQLGITTLMVKRSDSADTCVACVEDAISLIQASLAS